MIPTTVTGPRRSTVRLSRLRSCGGEMAVKPPHTPPRWVVARVGQGAVRAFVFAAPAHAARPADHRPVRGPPRAHGATAQTHRPETRPAAATGSRRRAASRADGELQTFQWPESAREGAKPSELPIEQPTKIELVINLRTARAIGVTIPRTPRLPATELIE